MAFLAGWDELQKTEEALEWWNELEEGDMHEIILKLYMKGKSNDRKCKSKRIKVTC